MASKKRLFLIDGSALTYRAYFAFQRQPLINSKGENTSAVFGFMKSLLRILDEQHPDYLAAVFDTPEPTFRHQLYPEYKATRQKMPDDMVEQLPRIRKMLRVMNIPVLEKPGFEADDIMGTLAKKAETQGIETYLVTGDKDFMQLVNASIKIYNPKRAGEEAEIIDVNGVEEKAGVPPEKIVDLMSLMGDSSDNVPGVHGIGPKIGLDLIRQFHSLENILDHPEKIEKDSIREKILADRKNAILSQKLVTIDTSMDYPIDFENLLVRSPEYEEAFQFCKELELTSLLDRFMKRADDETLTYVIIDSEIKLDNLIAELSKIKQFTLDLETTDVDPMKAQIVGLSFSWKEAEAYYIPVVAALSASSGDLFGRKESIGLPLTMVKDKLKPILENSDYAKCGQNIKYDMLVLLNHGLRVQGVDFDTMVASYVISPSLRQHNLDALSLEHLNYKKIPTSELIGSGKKQITMADVPLEKIARYACEDADITQRLRRILEPKLAEFNLDELFRTVELPLVDVLMKMEYHGVSLDIPFLKQMSRKLQLELDQLIDQIYEMAGQQFNINSTKQLSDILFKKIGLPASRRTKTGLSTDVRVLEDLAKQHSLPRALLDYRQLTKLKSTYIDALPRLIHPRTGRVHTSYNQTVAATGRLSSSEPNLQNIPIRTEVGRQIRRAFIPANDNYILVDADYSQIELRIMAHLSKDKTLMNSFLNNEDVHRRTAALVFKKSPEQVDEDLRRRAKEVNFGIMYGMGAYGLSSRLEIPLEEAETFISDYFNYYPQVKTYIDETIFKAKTRGYVTTLLNRRRYLPDILSENRRIREFAERTAINTPIQGSAADMIKVAMIRISNRIEDERLNARMIMQVHDELVFEVAKDQVDLLSRLVKEEMENAIQLDVPIRVDIGVAMNWLEAH